MKLTINESEYGLQWGMGAIEIYCDNMDCDIDGLDKVITLNRDQPKAIVTIILAAIRNWCELNEREFAVTYRQMQAWLDEAPQDTYMSIMDDFKNSKYLGRTISAYLLGEDPEPAKTPKKKSASVKSSKSVMKSA
jgi:hypothetical protein